MDGAPVFNMARNCLKGCQVEEIDGILNSTTNYILTRMEEGISLEEAVREAQKWDLQKQTLLTILMAGMQQQRYVFLPMPLWMPK